MADRSRGRMCKGLNSLGISIGQAAIVADRTAAVADRSSCAITVPGERGREDLPVEERR